MDGFWVGNVLQQKLWAFIWAIIGSRASMIPFSLQESQLKQKKKLSPAHVIIHSKGLLGRILLLGKNLLLLKLNCIKGNCRRRPGETRASSKEHPPNPHLNFKNAAAEKEPGEPSVMDGFLVGNVLQQKLRPLSGR
ncbi:hypothetical protein CEXT_192781 [Caerostris extrusa]|uniref:Uncharacterized protein n=1 Tax=Caerostris extrusa TaxID=172846 RepID=A0AAV4XVW1_CAEEX|nr:hypothetical protein CEXT_192781 [Caerostris extrusa]